MRMQILAAVGLLSTGVWTQGVLAQDQTSLALVLGVKGSPFYEAMACGAQSKADELGVKLQVSASDQWGPDQQLPIVNTIAAAAPSAAAIVPVDAQALIQPMKQLSELGINVLTVDQTLADSSFVKTAIVTDNREGGRLAAVELASLVGSGKVLVLTQPPGTTAQDQRTEGFEKEIANHTGITYVGAQYYTNPQQATEVMSAALARDPDLAGVFVTNDLGAIGVVTALRQANTAQVKVVSYDAATPQINALKNGQIQALIAQDPRREGELAVETAVALAKGEAIEPVTYTDIVVVRATEPEMADRYEYKAGC